MANAAQSLDADTAELVVAELGHKSFRVKDDDLLKDIEDINDFRKDACLLMADQINDPQNLGQIIRTYECAGIDGIIEPDVVANDTLEAIQNDQFLVTPHQQVREYIQFKAADYEGWIERMQNLQEQYINEIKSVIK